MAKIVLCTINAKWIHPSLALRLLRANLPLPEMQENCAILEFALRQNLSEKISAVLAEKPRILALSVSIWNHQAALELLRALESQWAAGERPALVLGGPELTPLPPDAEIFRYADFIIRGEGELVFSKLCQEILENREPAKKKYGRFIEGGEVNLNDIKSAYNLYTGEDLEHKLVYVESSRGCPFNCAFCRSAGGASIREFPLLPFLDDFEKLLNRCRKKSKTVKFLDRSFNVNQERALKILDACLDKTKNQRGADKDSFQFHFEMVTSVFPAELGDMLALFPAGTLRLEIGIQSLNPKTNKLIHRNSNPLKELEILRFIREKTTAILHVDLIAGLPAEDIDSFGKGFDRLWIVLSETYNSSETSNNTESADCSAPFEIQLGILKCLPGTPLYDMAQKGEFILKYQKTPPYEVTETDCLPAADMDKIKNFARFWELIVNRRSFLRLHNQLVPTGQPVFEHFMDISQKLLGIFGRNWGIAKNELENELINICNSFLQAQ